MAEIKTTKYKIRRLEKWVFPKEGILSLEAISEHQNGARLISPAWLNVLSARS
jgi:hypothetical protein